MKKLFLVLLFFSCCQVLFAQNASRTGTGNIVLTADKNTLLPGSNNTVAVTQQAIQFSNSNDISKNYPGYHTTIVNLNIASKESKPVVEITAPASGNPKSSGEYHKAVRVTDYNSSKNQPPVIDISDKVSPMK